MIQTAVSCGGVVIHHGKILLLYKNYRDRSEGWVLPKGTVEEGETFRDTACREVREETGASADIVKYIGETRYHFRVGLDEIDKTVHWFLMISWNYFSRPQIEEYFRDSGYYKYHEAYHLLKYENERNMMKEGYSEYCSIRDAHMWNRRILT